jgi:hypothetical protein
MASWVYKCNNRKKWHGPNYIGDWAEFFEDRANPEDTWGQVRQIPKLAQLQPRDTVFAYQTERNELVGVLTMIRLNRQGEIVLKVKERLGIKMRPLKGQYAAVSAMPAFKQGPKETLHHLSPTEAQLLLRLARAARDRKRRSKRGGAETAN